MAGRTTMRELLILARERLGADTARYKTREELVKALGLAGLPQPQTNQEPTQTEQPLVVKDFFLPR